MLLMLLHVQLHGSLEGMKQLQWYKGLVLLRNGWGMSK
jgi:hypothetical protein